MGLALKDVETAFNGLMNATRRAGLSMLDTKAAALKFGQAVGSGRLQGDELRALLERLPGMAQALADAFNNVAKRKGLQLISKEQAKQMTEALKEGERQQIANLRETVQERERILKSETRQILREIQHRYAEIEKQTNDHYDDIAAEEERRASEINSQRQEAISEEADDAIKAIQRRYEDERKARLNGREDMSDSERTYIERTLEDRQQAEIDAVKKRTRSTIRAEQIAAEEAQKQRSRSLRDQREKELKELRDRQQEEEQALTVASEKRLELIKGYQERELAAIKAANAKAQAEIVARTAATAGDIKKLGELGLLSAEVGVEAMRLFAAMPTPPPTPLQQLTTAFEDMRTELGEKFFPMIQEKMPEFIKLLENIKVILIELKPTLEIVLGILDATLKVINGLVYAFKALPEPIQNLLGFLINLRLGIAILGTVAGLVLGKTLPAVLTGFGVQLVIWLAKAEIAFKGLSLLFSATLVPAIKGALAGILAWMSGTFVPAMIGFFSGPAGWITLAVAALLFAFRDPIIKAIQFVVEEFKKLPGFLVQEARQFPKKFEEAYVIPVQKAFQSSIDNIKKGWGELMKSLESGLRRFATIFANIFKTIINSEINKLEKGVNFLIDGLNWIAKTVYKDRSTIPRVNVPELGDGGYATREAVVRIAERGEPEYVIPQRKMQRAAINVLQGYTGINVLNNRPSLPAETPPARNVTIQIKPNYVRLNGDEFVKASEFNQIINRVFSIMSEPEAQEAIRF
jgi:tape measure domain-containing protein